ncbi:MAG: NAD(+)/NADH kinase [Deltaproteobacteria bacterium]|nr:NAD(+)/NADH kinase [Deltaproteobacteria bacterium]
MSKVGIISNPASGKDIRRLVAYASVMDNVEKTNQVKRIIMGIDSTGVDEILIMPDYFCFGLRAINTLNIGKMHARITMLDMPVTATTDDSITAARMMREAGVGCIVTLGGDGTNRAVAKGDCSIPLVPLSTGTNNVFPVMSEATTAGVAAGIVALGILENDGIMYNHKRLIVLKNGEPVDMALIDAVVVDQLFIGSRAIWDLADVKQIICSRAEPNNIGMTSIAGGIHPLGPENGRGIYVKPGDGSLRVRAAILPGLFQEVGIAEYRILAPGDEVEVDVKPSVIALDGEREVTVLQTDNVRIRLQADGPPVVDVEKVLTKAALSGFFTLKNS